MPSPLQQQSRRRKLTYWALIGVLFTATLVWRGNFAEYPWTMKAQATALDLREQDMGEVELTASAVRLSLTGSRGLVICYLWYLAEEKKKRHEWNELELLVRSITKLQPHFITPWLFQGWNLSYNVSVESDRVKDKFFYISRGIELLAEGERQNRDNPDLRFFLGYTYHDKFGMADEANTLQTLFQMSCMDPAERDPRRFRGADGQIDLEQFEDFCRKHPQLVRRLRESYLRMRRSLQYQTPGEVVDFLADNQKIPTRYEETAASRLKPDEEQFPIFPIPRPDELSEWQRRMSKDWNEADPRQVLDDDFDHNLAARAWFSFSQIPLPPPNPVPNPGILEYDRTRYRVPRSMMSIIFRHYPARAQTYLAERLQKEGWFDEEGWTIRGWFPNDQFGGRDGRRPAVVGSDRQWAEKSWTEAHEMYKRHGQQNGLYLEPEKLQEMERRAQKYRQAYQVDPNREGPELRPEQRSVGMDASHDAHQQLHWYVRNRQVTNYHHFHVRTLVEKEQETIQARKAFFRAEQLRRTGDRSSALQMYEKAIPIWKTIFRKHRDFSRDIDVEEDTYEMQVKYMNVVRELRETPFKQIMVIQDLLAQGACRPPGVPIWLPPVQLLPGRTVPLFQGPFDGTDEAGQPWISPEAISRVRSRPGFPK